MLLTVGAGSAAAAPTGGYYNQYIQTYPTAQYCLTVATVENVKNSLPHDGQYFYCGGDSGTNLWLRLHS